MPLLDPKVGVGTNNEYVRIRYEYSQFAIRIRIRIRSDFAINPPPHYGSSQLSHRPYGSVESSSDSSALSTGSDSGMES
jgi:hypothetical protein